MDSQNHISMEARKRLYQDKFQELTPPESEQQEYLLKLYSDLLSYLTEEEANASPT